MGKMIIVIDIKSVWLASNLLSKLWLPDCPMLLLQFSSSEIAQKLDTSDSNKLLKPPYERQKVPSIYQRTHCNVHNPVNAHAAHFGHGGRWQHTHPPSISNQSCWCRYM
mmetsp:Transcript_5637/g.9550  ORF Transcript_5637/g.9550 Transcript_5637/m.9550 type:complete len:109 (-) Transcript_5637:320-646(-)